MKGYTSAERVGAILGLPIDDENTLLQIQLFISVAEFAVDAYCGTVFEEYADTELEFTGNGTTLLKFNRPLVNTTVTITEYDTLTNTLLDTVTTYCIVHPKVTNRGFYTYLERVDGYSFKETCTYKVTGDWGFADMPEPIKMAVALTVKHLWSLRSYDETVKTEYAFNRSLEYNALSGGELAPVPTMAKLLLNNYRIGMY